MSFNLKNLDFSDDFKTLNIKYKKSYNESLNDEDIEYIARCMIKINNLEHNDKVLDFYKSRTKNIIDSSDMCIAVAFYNNIRIGTYITSFNKFVKTVYIVFDYLENEYKDNNEVIESFLEQINSWAQQKKALLINFTSTTNSNGIQGSSVDIAKEIGQLYEIKVKSLPPSNP